MRSRGQLSAQAAPVARLAWRSVCKPPGGDPHERVYCTWAAVQIPRAPVSTLPLKADHHQPMIAQNHRVVLLLLARSTPPSDVFKEILNNAIPGHGPFPRGRGRGGGGGGGGVEARRCRSGREGRVGVREDEIDHFRDVGRFEAGIGVRRSIAAVVRDLRGNNEIEVSLRGPFSTRMQAGGVAGKKGKRKRRGERN